MGSFFQLRGDHTLGREESRGGLLEGVDLLALNQDEARRLAEIGDPAAGCSPSWRVGGHFRMKP